ncbi:hypothetical protein BJX76DRAFT_367666 [Aspergillus varians]
MAFQNREIYEAASRSREENPWLQNFKFYLDQYRNVQTTYHIQLSNHPDKGYAYRIWLLWDYDRIWGVFDLGLTKGIFLIDPGPKLPSSDHDLPQTLPFTWRGVRKSEPDFSLINEECTKGEICLDVLEGSFEGHFDFITGNGDAGHGRCAFRAMKHRGPSVVPYSLDDVVDDWNEYSPLGDEEDIRQDMSEDELEDDLRRRNAERSEPGVKRLKRSRDQADEDDE